MCEVTNLLAVEKAFLERHRESFVTKYPGRYLLIRGEKLHGDFDSREAAVNRGVKLFGVGPFLVRSPNEAPLRLVAPALTTGVPLVVNPESWSDGGVVPGE